MNALSVDLEEYFQVSNFERVIDRSGWDALPSRVRAPTERLLDLFDATGSRATFFVLGWVAERHGALVREVARRGHEVACHGYGHRVVYELGPQAFREDVRKGRQAVEDALGAPILGFRAPSFSITRESLWALRILAEEGFAYDSSVFPTRHPRYGIPEFATDPLEIVLEDGLSIQEFPLTTLRLGPLALPLAGGAYLRFFPELLFRWAFDRRTRAGRPGVLYLHPWEIDPDQPRQRVGWRVRVNHYHNLARTEARVGRLLGRHAFDSLGAVLEALRGAGRLPQQTLGEVLSTG